MTSISAEAATGGYTGSVSTLDAANLWFESCLFSQNCFSHPKALPTRLVAQDPANTLAFDWLRRYKWIQSFNI